MDKQEFKALLEEAFLEGYNQAELDFINESNNYFDLEREYNEATMMERIRFGIERLRNKYKYNDPKLKGLANKVAAAKIGTQRAANKMDDVVMDTYKKYDKKSKDKLMDANDDYGKSKRRENKYIHKLKLAEKDKANRPAVDDKSKSKQPVFRPAFA